MGTLNIKAKFGAELSYDTSTGDSTFQPIGSPIPQNAAVVIFDNQSNVAVAISDDGTTTGKTFAAGEAIALDLRANKGEPAEDLTWPIGTQFYANSTAGTGNFLIAYVYAH